MKKTNPLSEFITSAVSLDQCPQHSLKEIAVVGRSNVGKSSLLNLLLKRNLVKVSQTPGKTQLINFFSKEGKYYLVDLPGYGYAQLSKSVLEEWKPMIENYLLQREQLSGILMLLDARREIDPVDLDLIDSLRKMDLPLIFVFTKVDKLNKSELKIKTQKIPKHLSPYFLVSNLKKTGFDEVEDYIYKNWVLK